MIVADALSSNKCHPISDSLADFSTGSSCCWQQTIGKHTLNPDKNNDLKGHGQEFGV